MTTRIDVLVKTCEQCPFYNRGVASAIADALAKDDRKTGLCEWNARTSRSGQRSASPVATFAGLFNVVHIADPSGPPPQTCPLRVGETTVRIAL